MLKLFLSPALLSQVNRFNKSTDRGLLITDKYIYKLEPKKQYKVLKKLPLDSVSTHVGEHTLWMQAHTQTHLLASLVNKSLLLPSLLLSLSNISSIANVPCWDLSVCYSLIYIITHCIRASLSPLNPRLIKHILSPTMLIVAGTDFLP